VTEDAGFWYVYATYLHSEHRVTIGGSNSIPEFSPVQLLVIVLGLAVLIFRRTKPKSVSD
jgi:hypothetical protein